MPPELNIFTLILQCSPEDLHQNISSAAQQLSSRRYIPLPSWPDSWELPCGCSGPQAFPEGVTKIVLLGVPTPPAYLWAAAEYH